MQAVKTIGLDIAKSVFQVHGVDADGQVIIRRKLKRRYVLAFSSVFLGISLGRGPLIRSGRRFESSRAHHRKFHVSVFC